MNDERYPQTLRDRDGIVSRRIIDEKKVVDNSHRDFRDRFFESSSGIVCGKNYHDALALDHRLLLDQYPVGGDRGETCLVLIAGVGALFYFDHLDLFENLEPMATCR